MDEVADAVALVEVDVDVDAVADVDVALEMECQRAAENFQPLIFSIEKRKKIASMTDIHSSWPSKKLNGREGGAVAELYRARHRREETDHTDLRRTGRQRQRQVKKARVHE